MPAPRKLARKLKLKGMAAIVMKRDSASPDASCPGRGVTSAPTLRRRMA
jgi:hypothetical protein